MVLTTEIALSTTNMFEHQNTLSVREIDSDAIKEVHKHTNINNNDTNECLCDNGSGMGSIILKKGRNDKIKSKESKEVHKLGFSQHNRSLRFSKYLSRKEVNNCITMNIPFLSTEKTK